MNITLCDKILKGDVPEYQINDKDEASELIYYWLENKDFSKNVYVCFLSWQHIRDGNYRDEIATIIVTHSQDDIDLWVCDMFSFQNWNMLNLNIFEFESYQDAFDYCKDLQEGI